MLCFILYFLNMLVIAVTGNMWKLFVFFEILPMTQCLRRVSNSEQKIVPMASRAWLFAGTARSCKSAELTAPISYVRQTVVTYRLLTTWFVSNTLCYFEECESIVYDGLYPSCRLTSCKFDREIDSTYEDVILNLWTNWRNRKRNFTQSLRLEDFFNSNLPFINNGECYQ